jgi:hypothetical protein
MHDSQDCTSSIHTVLFWLLRQTVHQASWHWMMVSQSGLVENCGLIMIMIKKKHGIVTGKNWLEIWEGMG